MIKTSIIIKDLHGRGSDHILKTELPVVPQRHDKICCQPDGYQYLVCRILDIGFEVYDSFEKVIIEVEIMNNR